MVLSGNNLCKSFQGKEVIKDMDLSLSEGKVHILEGKSGCGKSTLMTLLGLLDSLDKGTIFLDGKQLSGLGSKETEEKRSRNFSFLSQDDNLVEYLSLEDNLFLVTKDRKRIQEGASRLEISSPASEACFGAVAGRKG
jgi:putative ABC transport system ATP-binding protein